MPTELRRGQIAIIAYATDDASTPPEATDLLRFVLLAPVTTGTVIHFSNRSWNGSSFTAAAGEGTFTWTAGANLPAGTVITITNAELDAAGIDLSSGGETVYAYQGTANVPTAFLFAIDVADGNSTFNGNLTNTGLVVGNSAVAVQWDNAAYAGAPTGIAASNLAGIVTSTRWFGTDQDDIGGTPYTEVTHTGIESPFFDGSDFVILAGMAGGGQSDAILRIGAEDGALTAQNVARLFRDNPEFHHISDVAFDLDSGFYFVVDSDGNSVNRILRGDIADLVSGTASPTFTQLFATDGQNNGAGPVIPGEIIPSMELNRATNKIVWIDGDFFGNYEGGWEVRTMNYDGTGNTVVAVIDTENAMGSPLGGPPGIADYALHETSNTLYIVASLAGIDGLGNATVYQNHLMSVNLTSGAITTINMGAADPRTTTGGGSYLDGRLDPAEGQIIGIDVHQATGIIYFVTQPISATATSGIWSYDPATDTLTELWEQPSRSAFNTLQTFPISNMINIEVDEIGGRLFVTTLGDSNHEADSTDGATTNEHDASIHMLAIGAAVGTAPTRFARIYEPTALGSPLGLEINYDSSVAVTTSNATYTESTTALNSPAGPVVTPFTNAIVTDPDQVTIHGATVAITSGFVLGDTLSFTNSGGITGTYTAATGLLVFTGAAGFAAYQTVLDSVRFTNAGDNPTNYGANQSRTLSVTTFDGLTHSDVASVTLAVVGINDAPVNAGAAPSGAAFVEDAVNLPLTGFSVSDVDADPATQNLRVTFQVTHGTLDIRTDVVGGITAGMITGGADGSGLITVTATANQINATLGDATGLTYTPPAHFNGNATFAIVTNDLGNTGNDPGLTGDGTSEQDQDGWVINIAAVNDAPTVTDATQAAAAILEDTPSAGGQTVASLFGASFSDALDDQTATGGSSPNTLAGIAVVGGSTGASGSWQYFDGAIWVDIGPASTASAVLINFNASIRFDPAADFNGSPPDLIVHLIDNSGPAVTNGEPANLTGATGGTTRYSADTVALSQSVTAVNDAPANSVPATQTIDEDASVTFTGGNAISVADVDLAAGDLTTTLSIESGTLTLSGTAGLVVTGDGTILVTLTGTAAAINTALDGLVYAPPANFNGSRTLTMTTNDNGNTGQDPGGDPGSEQDVDTVVINVTALNDTPVVTVAATLAATEQIVSTIDPAATIADIDLDALNAGNGDYAGATLTVANNAGADANDLLTIGTSGLFTVSGSNLQSGGQTFATFTGGNGSQLDVTFTSSGTPATTALVNAVLQSLQYTYTGDNPPVGGADLAVSLDDGAPVNAGQGSVISNPAVGTDVIHVSIVDTPENVAPTISLDSANAAYAEVPGPNSSGAAVNVLNSSTVGDVDDTSLESATVRVVDFVAGDILAIDPNFNLSGNFAVSYDSGTGILTITGTDSLANYQAALDNVVFSHTGDNPDVYGTDIGRTIGFTVYDGIASSTEATATVTIAAQDDGPVNAMPAPFAVNEDDVAVTVTGLQVGDPDTVTADPYTVRLSVQHGTLSINTAGFVTTVVVEGNNGTNGITLRGPTSEINAAFAGGALTYSPDPNYNIADSLTVSTYDGVAADATTFAAAVPYAAQPGAGQQFPWDIVNGDLNGDGFLDLVVGYDTGNQIGVLLGNGDGSFDPAVYYSSGDQRPVGIAIVNVNPSVDSFPDLVITNVDGNNATSTYSVLQGNGDGTFQAPVNTNLSQANAITVADFNRDLIPDVAITRRDAEVSILLGTGTGLAAPVTYFTDTGFNVTTISVAAGDFNNDGRLDLIGANGAGLHGLSYLAGTGTGTFGGGLAAPITSPVYNDVAAADFNNDGNLDIVATTIGSGVAAVYLGNGTGGTFGFAAPTNLAIGGGGYTVTVADVNGDGLVDILATRQSANLVVVFRSLGNGNWAAGETFAAGANLTAITAGDFDGDGDIDLATADLGSNPSTISVLLNATANLGDVDTVAITVNPVNDAPVDLIPGATQVNATILEDAPNPPGVTIATFLANRYSDAADDQSVFGGSSPGSFGGIAVVSNDASGTTGQWQYSTNGGASWSDIGAATPATAQLFNSSSMIRFLPAADFFGVAPWLNVRLIDNSFGAITDGATAVDLSAPASVGGTTPFSSGTINIEQLVNPVNDAPVLDAGFNAALNGLNEDSGAPVGAVGTPITLIADLNPPAGGPDNVTDVDNVVTGIALVGTDTANGTFYYSIDGGANWTLVGAVSNSSALLLAADANTRLYFQPNPDFSGTISSAITFRAWDRSAGGANGTSGVDTGAGGGSSAFSAATDTAVISVFAINDAPIIDLQSADGGTIDNSAAYTENGAPLQLVSFANLAITDVDNANLQSATVSIADFQASDLLTIFGTVSGSTVGINYSYNPLTGVMTLTGNATLANWRNALNNVSFSSTSDDPTLGGTDTQRTINWVVNDGALPSATAVTTLTITAVNDAPTLALSPFGTATEQVAHDLKGLIALGDVDAGGGTVTVTLGVDYGFLTATAGTSGALVSGSGSAAVTLTGTIAQIQALLAGDPTSTFAFTADTDAPPASALLSVQVDDGGNIGAGGPATVSASGTIAIAEVDDPLTAVGEDYSLDEDTQLSIPAPGLLANDSDPDLKPLTTTVLADVQHGILVLNPDGSFVYTPTPDYSGPDSFTYTVSDGASDSATATVTLTVRAVNDIPVANDDTAVTNEDSSVNIRVIDNDTDADVGSVLNFTMVSDPAHGSVQINGDGSLTYTPDPDFNGVDTFQYEITDDQGRGDFGTDTATVTVTVDPVNDAPFGSDGSVTGSEDDPYPFTAADFGFADPLDGDDLAGVWIVTLPGQGVLRNNGIPLMIGDFVTRADIDDGGFQFLPDPDEYSVPFGSTYASFQFRVQDDGGTANGGDDTADQVNTLDIVITPDNVPPVANDDAYALDEDTTLIVGGAGVIANDSDDGAPPPAQFTAGAILVDGPDHAAAFTFNADGTFSYTPLANYNGTDTFTYKLNDTMFDSNVATVTLTINPVNDAPVTVANSYVVAEDTLLGVGAPGLLGNDSDIDSPSITAVLVDGPDHAASFTFNADGSFTYQAVADYNGPDSFSYRASDGSALGNIVTVDLTVTPVDDPSVTQPDLFVTSENGVISGLNVFADHGSGPDYDIDGPPLAVTEVNGSALNVGQLLTLASGATLQLNANGTFTYNTNNKFNTLTSVPTGASNTQTQDSFTYRTDSGNTATVVIQVNGLRTTTDLLIGSAGNDTITDLGVNYNDSFLLQQGGNDSAYGLGGNDGFYFGAAMNQFDTVDGGSGTDSVAVQGNYANLILGNMTNVENFVLLAGNNMMFGDLAGNFYDYAVTTNDVNVGPGGTLNVIGGNLRVGEDLVFNGAAETDGNFRIFAGQGNDTLTGGAKNDGFFFGADANLNGLDSVNGNGGIDSIALRGNYVGATAVVMQNASMTNVEVVAFLSGHTNEFGGAINLAGFDYDFTSADGNVAAGQRLEVAAGNLRANESLRFDGRAELDGSFRIVSGTGDDTLFGGAGDDILYGNRGADRLEGGAGADTYLYRFADESVAGSRDLVIWGVGDKIDLSLIDANINTGANDAFAFIGAAAFSGVAGQLRVTMTGANGIVEGDVNGDGATDFTILIQNYVPVAGDFVL